MHNVGSNAQCGAYCIIMIMLYDHAVSDSSHWMQCNLLPSVLIFSLNFPGASHYFCNCSTWSPVFTCKSSVSAHLQDRLQPASKFHLNDLTGIGDTRKCNWNLTLVVLTSQPSLLNLCESVGDCKIKHLWPSRLFATLSLVLHLFMVTIAITSMDPWWQQALG